MKGRVVVAQKKQTHRFCSRTGSRSGYRVPEYKSRCGSRNLSQRQPRIQESHAVARKPRDAAAVLFGLRFADNIYYKFTSSQASKARLHSSKRTGAKQNSTQNGHSRSFKVTCFGVSGKVIRN